MHDHTAIRFEASAEDLHALSDVTGYVRDTRLGHNLWLMRGGEAPLLVSSTSKTVAPMLEVFTLTIRTEERALVEMQRWREAAPELPDYIRKSGLNLVFPPFPERLEPPDDAPHPLKIEGVSLLAERDWLADALSWPEDYKFDGKGRPGAIPLATTHACWSDVGILFRGAGRSTLITHGRSYDVRVTDDPAEIAEFVADCREVSLDDYLAERAAEL